MTTLSSEKELQKKIIKFLKDSNRFVLKTQGGVSGTPIGTPDIITMADNGKIVTIEVKNPNKNHWTLEQQAMSEKIKARNGYYLLVDSFTDFTFRFGTLNDRT